MQSVLLVEDEILVAIGLKNIIDWESLGMQVAAIAKNGQEAYEIYQKTHPSLIITDLTMPVMDGLELIAKVRENDRRTRFVVLTCHDEFKLLQRAIRLGVSDYVLKLNAPDGELERILRRVGDEILAETCAGAFPREGEPPAPSGAFLEEYLAGEGDDRRLQEGLCELFGGDACALCYILSRVEVTGRVQGDLILNLINDQIKRYDKGTAFMMPGGGIIALLPVLGPGDMRGRMEYLVRRINEALLRCLNAEAFFGVGGTGPAKDLAALAQRAGEALERRYFLPEGESLAFAGEDSGQAAIGGGLAAVEACASRLQEAFPEYFAQISMGIGQMRAAPALSRQEFVTQAVRMVHWPEIAYRNRGGGDFASACREYAQEILTAPSYGQAVSALCRFLEAVASARTYAGLSPEVRRALAYMKGGYAREITLASLAEHVGISAPHLSRQFARELGEGFSELLNRIRLEQAVRLLESGKMRSHEVAYAVGFTDPSYFSRVFKKYAGMRPSEYRRGMALAGGGLPLGTQGDACPAPQPEDEQEAPP